MWIAALKSVRAEGVFATSFFELKHGVWTVRIDECIKLLATVFHFKNEAVFVGVGTFPGDLLRRVNGNVKDYVNLIRLAILKLGKKRTTDTCPGNESMRLQCERMKAVFGYWQDGLQEEMSETSTERDGVSTPQGRAPRRQNAQQRIAFCGCQSTLMSDPIGRRSR